MKNTKLTLLTTTVLAAFTLAAYAGTDSKDMKEIKSCAETCPDDGFYVAAYGGANFSQDYGNGRAETSVPGIIGTTVTTSSNSDNLGGAGGIKLGYKFLSTPIGGGFALQPAVELEALYLGTTEQRHATGNNPVLGATSTDVNSDFNEAAFMVNGILRLKTPWMVTPYFGAGIGGEYINSSNTTFNNTVFGGAVHTPTLSSSYSDDTFAFAAQALAGFDVALDKHWTLFTEYKFIAAIDPSLTYNNVYAAGDKVHVDPDFIGQHLITAGVKYNF